MMHNIQMLYVIMTLLRRHQKQWFVIGKSPQTAMFEVADLL